MPTIQEDKTSGRKHIVLPKPICDLKGWKKGTELELKERHGEIYLVEKF